MQSIGRNSPLRAQLRPHVDRARTYRNKQRLRQATRRPDPRIIVGALNTRFNGWAATDRQFLDLLQEADWRRWFLPDSLSTILSEHVWEHLEPADANLAAGRCFRYLRPGGWIRVAVPDGNHPDPDYIESVKPGGTGPGADDHRVLYTVDSMSEVFARAGFEVRPLEWFDDGGRFQYRPWSAEHGPIQRSMRNDDRNRDGVLRYTSIIVDAIKPS